MESHNVYILQAALLTKIILQYSGNIPREVVGCVYPETITYRDKTIRVSHGLDITKTFMQSNQFKCLMGRYHKYYMASNLR